jgi:hypothetical protein
MKAALYKQASNLFKVYGPGFANSATTILADFVYFPAYVYHFSDIKI